MERLEVSGAVRPIYGSLGVKRIITIFFFFTWMVIYLVPNYNICAVYTRKSLFSLLQFAEIYRFDKSWKGV